MNDTITVSGYDGMLIQFTREALLPVVKEYGWDSVDEFLDEYTWDATIGWDERFADGATEGVEVLQFKGFVVDDICGDCGLEVEVLFKSEEDFVPVAQCPHCKAEVILCGMCNMVGCAGCEHGNHFKPHCDCSPSLGTAHKKAD